MNIVHVRKNVRKHYFVHVIRITKHVVSNVFVQIVQTRGLYFIIIIKLMNICINKNAQVLLVYNLINLTTLSKNNND